jgi:hypothetical protein
MASLDPDPDSGTWKLTKTWFPALQKGLCTIVGMFFDLLPTLFLFSCKNLTFYDFNLARIRSRICICFAPRIRFRLGIKSWIQICIETMRIHNTNPYALLQAVLRIHDIVGWIRIRIRRTMPLTNGSGFCYFSSLTFRMPAKN